MVKKPLSVPSSNVDDIWHCHLELNVDYNRFTKNLLGYILPHQPFLDGDEPDPQSKTNLIEASFQYFGKFVFDPTSLDCSAKCGRHFNLPF
jgi:hypothetical protein